MIAVVKSSLKNYINHGRPKGVWAFKDKSNPKEIMKMLEDDYVIFVNLSCKPARMIFPEYRNQNYLPGKKSKIRSRQISWHLNFVDIAKVTKGYHLNFEDKSPYDGFDEDWMKKSSRLPEQKEFTQFVRFNFDHNDKNQKFWSGDKNKIIPRNNFRDTNDGLIEFCNAVRDSLCVQGDAREISKISFDALHQILKNY